MYKLHIMTSILKSKTSSRRTARLLVLVGMFAGVAVVGGDGLIASAAGSTSSTITACVHKKTKVVRITTKCTKSEKKTTWSTTGAKGDTGATGPAGPTGSGGGGITGLSVCDGPDAGTVADELCKIGMTGPGGGPVFFIDDENRFASFCATGDCNYLEASPADVDEAGGDFTSDWCSDTTTDLGMTGWDKSSIGAGRTNTATADTTCTSGAVQAAVDYAAPAFNGIAKDDWWLPSIGEAMMMYANLRPAGVGNFSSEYYWSSSERNAGLSWVQNFSYGDQSPGNKTGGYRVRPVRGF